MKELDKDTLRMLQMIELEMLLEVNRICEKYDIPYNIIGGTLLGAIRHNGFIPWDDDADITMLRNDYNYFRNICKKELDNSRFYFQDAENTDGYRWSYGKIRRKNTLFLREYQEHMPYEQGVFIDIFPVDNIPNNYLHRISNEFHCFCIRKILWSEVGRIAEKNILKRKIYDVLNKIPREVILKHYNQLVIKINKKESKYVRIALMPFPNKRCGYLKKWYLESNIYEFEGYFFKGIKNYHDFLTFEFGDYMQLPPISKRKIHPVSDISVFENYIYKEKMK